MKLLQHLLLLHHSTHKLQQLPIILIKLQIKQIRFHLRSKNYKAKVMWEVLDKYHKHVKE
jgi:hypothetical protein